MKRECYSDWHSAYQEAKQLPFALIRCLSSLYIGENPGEISTQELEEARFFGPEAEICIFCDGTSFTAMKTMDSEPEAGDLFLDIEESFPGHHKIITRRQYVSYDQDGQAFISAVRMVSCKEG